MLACTKFFRETGILNRLLTVTPGTSGIASQWFNQVLTEESQGGHNLQEDVEDHCNINLTPSFVCRRKTRMPRVSIFFFFFRLVTHGPSWKASCLKPYVLFLCPPSGVSCDSDSLLGAWPPLQLSRIQPYWKFPQRWEAVALLYYQTFWYFPCFGFTDVFLTLQISAFCWNMSAPL